MHSSDSSLFPSLIRSFRGEWTSVAGPRSCHLEHLASRNLLGRIERRMCASIQSLTGLQQNPSLMPRLCSADHHAGRLTGGDVVMGGNVKPTRGRNFADSAGFSQVHLIYEGVSIPTECFSPKYRTRIFEAEQTREHMQR